MHWHESHRRNPASWVYGACVAADRGRDLSSEEMDAAGATVNWYTVKAAQP